MKHEAISIATRDGHAPASLFIPDGQGPFPGVIVYMDGLGKRSAIDEIGERIAARGYVSLVPNLFYRHGTIPSVDPARFFSDAALRSEWVAKYIRALTSEQAMSDTRAFLDELRLRNEVGPGKIGTTGYCMGGAHALSAAGTFPDEIGAAASFHGGMLATDRPDSPHLLAGKMNARVYVAGAVSDPSFPDDMKVRLKAALEAAHVDHTVETYAGCTHGWVPSDTPMHDQAGAARHYEALFALYHRALR